MIELLFELSTTEISDSASIFYSSSLVSSKMIATTLSSVPSSVLVFVLLVSLSVSPKLTVILFLSEL